MSSPTSIEKHISADRYVPVHKRSPSSTSLPMRQTPVSDANRRCEFDSVDRDWRSTASADSVSRNSSPSLHHCGVAGTVQITARPDLLDFRTEAGNRRRHGIYSSASTTDKQQVLFSYQAEQSVLTDKQVEEDTFPHEQGEEVTPLRNRFFAEARYPVNPAPSQIR